MLYEYLQLGDKRSYKALCKPITKAFGMESSNEALP